MAKLYVAINGRTLCRVTGSRRAPTLEKTVICKTAQQELRLPKNTPP
jgi:hypothetical protein